MNYSFEFKFRSEQGVEFVSIILDRKITHPVEKEIVESRFNKTYKDIADNTGYTLNSVKGIGQNLMEEIRDKTGIENLNKSNAENLIIKLFKNKQVSLKNSNTVSVDSELDLLYPQLEHFLQFRNWKVAEIKTSQIMLTLAYAKKQGYLDKESILRIPCEDLRKIDRLWGVHSDNNYGFSVQAKIWSEKGNRLNIKKEEDWTQTDIVNYLQFADSVGWLDPNNKRNVKFGYGEFLQYDELMSGLEGNPIKGSLPTYNNIFFERRYHPHWHRTSVFFSHFMTCKNNTF